MAGFTKLVPEIIQSSIWNEPSDVRVVWITMLAIVDEDGYVRGDHKTLARMANVPVDVAELALQKFQEPDPTSHTPDNEGRRVTAAPGGWTILNYHAYRQRDRKAYMREYMKDYRTQKPVNSVNINKCLPSASASSSASVPEGKQGEAKSKGPTLDEQAVKIYEAYPLKVGKPAALRAIRCAISKHGADTVWAKTVAFAEARAGDKTFMPNPSTWFNQERYNDDPSTWVRATETRPNSRTEGTFNHGIADQYADAYSK